MLAAVPARVLVEPTTNHEAVIQAIQRVLPQEVACDFSSALGLAFPKNGEKNTPRRVEMWSGFRRGSVNLEIPLDIQLANRAENVSLIAIKPLVDQPTNFVLNKCSLSRISANDDNNRQVKVDIRREGDPLQKTIEIGFQNTQGELINKSEVSWNENINQREFDIDIQIDTNANQALVAALDTDAQPLDNKFLIRLGQQKRPKSQF